MLIFLCSLIALMILMVGAFGFLAGRWLQASDRWCLRVVQVVTAMSTVPAALYLLGFADRLADMLAMGMISGAWLLGSLVGSYIYNRQTSA